MKAIIVGGGIGGLTTALMLRSRGIDCELYEQAETIRELGVGINTLPHAIRELAQRHLASGTARLAGAIVTFLAVPGMTPEWLQRLIDCHLARNAALGHVVLEMPDCPLVLRGVSAHAGATENGFEVAISSEDADTAKQIQARAQRLQRAAGPR